MPAWGWILIAIGALAIIVTIAWYAARRTQLRKTFGPEYDRTISESESRRTGESELKERERRRRELDIRPLSSAAWQRYTEAWATVQRRFVDDPGGATLEADRLVGEVMEERGYPVEDFEQQAADLSVDHPELVQNYRAAHSTWLRHERGDATTEELRRAMVHYRALFDELLGMPEAARR